MVRFKILHKDKGPWDKLCPERFTVGAKFTTFRAYDPRKDVYYTKLVGKTTKVEHEGQRLGTAELIFKEYKWSTELTLEQIQWDTYQEYNREDFYTDMKTFYNTHSVFGLLLVFQVLEVSDGYDEAIREWLP